MDAAYREIRGVQKVTSGYAGGTVANPTYEQVSSGQTGHAEVVQIEYDPKIIDYRGILEIFWAIHNPTTLNRQGNDVGPQYRSIILYHNEQQKKLAEQTRPENAKLWEAPIVTEIAPLAKFYPAGEEHQEYFRKNPSRAYCQLIINPKLVKLRQRFQARLKT